MRVLRALYNFAMEYYEDPNGKGIILENPVLRLNKIDAWYPVKRRRKVLKNDELKAWYKAVADLSNTRSTGCAEVMTDYFHTLLFTGLRKNEAAKLDVGSVDLKNKTFIAEETKNWEEHALPMSQPVLEIMKRRCKASNQWLFPSNAAGPISNIQWWGIKITKASGVQFSPNDIRRTFISVAESLDLSGYTLKRLLNHKIVEHDVTAGYIVTDVERLRKPMDRAKAAGVPYCHA